MMSQGRTQTISINILSDILKSKSNQTTKFGQVIEYNIGNIFLQKSRRQEARRLVPDLFLYFKKTLYKVNASG